MGVSGAGKTAVGEKLAAAAGWPFVDGDDLHPRANREKMSAGVPLSDVDRQPWLQAIRGVVEAHGSAGTSVIIACSALKRRYRKVLSQGTSQVRIVYLKGDPTLIERRLRQRRGHFFDPNLLSSQFAALEEPAAGEVVEVNADLDSVVASVAAALDLELGCDLQKE